MAVFTANYFSNALMRATDYTAIIPIEPSPFQPLPGVKVPDLNAPLKTIYLLHGFCGNHHDWLTGTRINEYCKTYGVAVICPSGENSFYIDDVKRDAFYERMLCKELIEHTRKVFPLSKERSDTMIAGLSMGGYGAIYNGFKYHDVFGNIGAFSSALIIDTIAKGVVDSPMISKNYYLHTFGDLDKVVGGEYDPKKLASDLMNSGTDRPKLFMSCGTEDFMLLEANRDLHRHLNDIGYDHEYAESPGGHEWNFWDEYIQKAMKWFAGW